MGELNGSSARPDVEGANRRKDTQIQDETFNVAWLNRAKLTADKVTLVQQGEKTYYVFPDALHNQAYVGGLRLTGNSV